MAEALGIASSIVGIVALADVVASKGIRLYTTIKDCPKEIKILVDEVDGLCGLLGTLKRRYGALMGSQNTAGFSVHSESLLQGCEETLDMIDRILTKSEARTGETWANMVKRVKWKYRKEDALELLERVERHKSSFQLALSLDRMETLQELLAGNSTISQHILESKGETIQEIERSKRELLSELKQMDNRQAGTRISNEQKEKDKRRLEVLSWLSPVDFRGKHNEVKRHRYEDTGNWFLKSSEFLDWLGKPAPANLLCKGTPGVGKTFITSKIVDHLESLFPDVHGDVAIAYVYCEFKQRVTQTPELIFASILQQLAYRQPNLDPEIDVLYKDRNSPRPPVEMLISAILSISRNFNAVYIVFDALDECDKNQRKDILTYLQGFLRAPFKILATSRPHPLDITAAFKGAAKVTIRAHDDDIECYVRQRIKQELSTGITIKRELTEIIVRQITSKAEGIFLLAKFHIEYILSKLTARDKRKAAISLTSDLTVVYGAIMATIEENQESRELSLKILKWISAATRPLQFQELQIAISIEDGDAEIDEEGFLDAKTMVDLCGGLIAIEQETGAVRFVHHTVQEYVLSNSSISNDAHLLITKTCLTYLSLETRHRKLFDRTLARIKGWYSIDERHFWDYAACNWAFHMRTIGEPKDLSIRVLAMLASPDLLYALARTIWWYSWDANWLEKDYQSLPLHIFAVSGLNRLVQLALKDSSLSIDLRGFCDGILPPSRADFKDAFGQTPLALASREGHEAVVHYLAGREDVNPDSKDGYDRTPLALAAKGGHEAVVRFLAERIGVEVDSRDRYDRTPLSLAAEKGHEAVVRFLAERTDVDADSRDIHGQTPLSLAAQNGHEAVVRFLADRVDVDADSRDIHGDTPLPLAAGRGQEVVARYLADRTDVDADSKNEDGRTPLSWAAMNGHEMVVHLLANRTDVDADWKDFYGQTPLSWAAENGHEAVVRFLAERADIVADSADNTGWTPLLFAAAHGHLAVVRFLVERADVSVNSKDTCGKTPLSSAAENGYGAVVHFLTDRTDVGADLEDHTSKKLLSF